MATTMLREAVGVFHDLRSLQGAVDDLLLQGFDRSCLSLLATRPTVERELGAGLGHPDQIADHPAAPRMGYVGRDSRVEGKAALAGGLAYVAATAATGVVVSGGMLFGIAVIAVAGGAAGVLGMALARRFDGVQARYFEDQLERGGILLWVRTTTEECESKACAVLKANGASNVHVHDMPFEESRREGGVSQHFAWIDKPVAQWLLGRSAPPAQGGETLPPRPH